MSNNFLAITFVIVLLLSVYFGAKIFLKKPNILTVPELNILPIKASLGSFKVREESSSTQLVVDSPIKKIPSIKPIEVSPFLPYRGMSCLISPIDKKIDYFAYFPYKVWPIASLSKLMTAVIALENYSPNKIITISKKDLEIYGNSAHFRLNQKYKVKDLVKIMILTSSNDAAYALAKELPNFIDLMNKKAKEIGMFQTRYIEPSGLSKKNVSSAADLLKLSRYILKNHPEILEVDKENIYKVGKRIFYNINKIRRLPNFIGGKTGYIPESKENAISIFSLNGQKIVIIVLGSNDRLLSTQKLLSWFKLIRLAEETND